MGWTGRAHGRVVAFVAAACDVFVDGPAAQESPTVAAMQDEMKRSMAELRMKGEAAPYYIAYEVLDRTMADVSGRLGAIIENPPRRTRTLRVEVRVGDYTFDSSRFVVQGFGGGGGLSGETVIAPLDDDYDAMRREIWLTTDAAYKRAITMFARKKAAFQNRTASDPNPGFFAGAAGRDDPPAIPADVRAGRPCRISSRACSSPRRSSRRILTSISPKCPSRRSTARGIT